jgi:hypothetical protein
MAGAGSIVTGFAIVRGVPKGIWVPVAYFTAMEGLQAAGYAVVGQCDSTSNQTITLLSYLHIVFQPFFVNAFAMELVPGSVRARLQRIVYALCGVSAAVMLFQLVPLDWAGVCRPGDPLCGAVLCLQSGNWHIAWSIPYNGLLRPLEDMTGIHSGFPTYMLTVFALPLLYGAWKFVVFHAVAGPFLAWQLTGNPNEMPAVWCLFSIGLLLIGMSPLIRRKFEVLNWWAWPKAWQV